MRRTATKSRITDNRWRHHVRLEGDLCIPGTHASRIVQAFLLEAVAQDLSLVACGGESFEKLSMRHDGERWVLEAEAVIEDPGTTHAPTR